MWTCVPSKSCSGSRIKLVWVVLIFYVLTFVLLLFLFHEMFKYEIQIFTFTIYEDHPRVFMLC